MAARTLRVGVTELLRHPGSRFEIVKSVDAGDLGELVVGATRADPVAEIGYDLILESQSETIVASGVVTAQWVGECRRCLDPIGGELQHELREVFGTVAPGQPDDGDLYPLTGDELDLEPLLRDAVLLSLPVAPLCGPDCRGPVPEVFERPVFDAEEPLDPDADLPRDPRWAGLDALDFE